MSYLIFENLMLYICYLAQPGISGFFGGVALHLYIYLFTDILALRKNFEIPKIFYSESVLKGNGAK